MGNSSEGNATNKLLALHFLGSICVLLLVIGDKDGVGALSSTFKDFCRLQLSCRIENGGFHLFFAICMVVGR